MGLNLDSWDERITRDLNDRISKYDGEWRQNENYVRNRGDGTLHSNLIKEFETVLYHRVINRDPVIKVSVADNEYQDAADKYAIVANDISRIANIKSNLRQATLLSTYELGWLEIGHPLAAFGLDPKRHSALPNNVTEDSGLQSQWEEVDPSKASAYGVNLEEVDTFDPLQFNPNEALTLKADEPKPVFNDGGIGVPYIDYVSGYHMITPREIYDIKDAEYVARLRVMTKEEILIISGLDVDETKQMDRKWYDLFPDIDFDFLNPAFLVVECWVKRDRLNSRNNNWFGAWILNNQDVVLRDQTNPWGGMIPYIPVKVSRIGKFLDGSLVQDLTHVAKMYSIALQSLDRDLLDSLNPKVMTGGSAKIKSDDIKKLLNPSYRGEVKVQGRPEDIKIERGPGLDINKIQYLRLMRELAQQTSSTSEIDKGQAIKKITARQTEALVESTGLIIGGMRELVAEAAVEVVTKLMYVLGIFHGYKKEYEFGGNKIKFDPGMYDFTTNMIYRIDVADMGPEPGETEKLLEIQFLRTVSMNPVLSQQFDWNKYAESLARLFKKDRSVVLPKPPFQPGLSGGLDILPEQAISAVGPNPGRGPTDQSQSLNPMALSMQQGIEGMRRTG